MTELESPYDFRDADKAAEWAESISLEAEWRGRFFDRIALWLNETRPTPFSVIELGSGPGHLAKVIVDRTQTDRYCAVDYSEAMHALATAHIGAASAPLTFAQLDFRRDDWGQGLGTFDIALSFMAAHEVRLKERLRPLFEQVAELLNPGGALLFADFYAASPDDPLYLTRQGQHAALLAAGFDPVEMLLDHHGMALHAASLP